MEPNIKNILEQDSLKWIFVGGKGGVGKTTNSCSIAVQLSKVRKSVLLISTDPAHNLSDAFAQKFNGRPQLINGFNNLYAMEVDPASSKELVKGTEGDGDGTNSTNPLASMSKMWEDLAGSIPGIDEAVAFSEVMKFVNSLDYSVVVFDTAPTGHTLRFLSFPNVLEKGMEKLVDLGGRFGPLLKQMATLMGVPADKDFTSTMEEYKSKIHEVNSQFKDAEKTTFVCVCISEFLSLYETERMIQELTSFDIDTHNIIVNQLLYPADDSNCQHCKVRQKMQKKYLEQIHDLYEGITTPTTYFRFSHY
jgi:arsenite-transporting ATPase